MNKEREIGKCLDFNPINSENEDRQMPSSDCGSKESPDADVADRDEEDDRDVVDISEICKVIVA